MRRRSQPHRMDGLDAVYNARIIRYIFGNVDRDNGMFVSNRDQGDDGGQHHDAWRPGLRTRPFGFRMIYTYEYIYVYYICIRISV